MPLWELWACFKHVLLCCVGSVVWHHRREVRLAHRSRKFSHFFFPSMDPASDNLFTEMNSTDTKQKRHSVRGSGSVDSRHVEVRRWTWQLQSRQSTCHSMTSEVAAAALTVDASMSRLHCWCAVSQKRCLFLDDGCCVVKFQGADTFDRALEPIDASKSGGALKSNGALESNGALKSNGAPKSNGALKSNGAPKPSLTAYGALTDV